MRNSSRALNVFLLLLFSALPMTACAQQEGAAGDAGEVAAEGAEAQGAAAAGETTDMAGDAGAMAAGDAPVCEFTASGADLTGRASPPDSAMVQLGDGVAKICYGAPSARGRDIMGGLVPYGQPWRLGANEPTTLHLTTSAEVGSVQVDAGSYALYTIPGESEWTIVVNGAPDRWGIPIDEAVQAEDIGSFTVTPEATDAPVEQLMIDLQPADGGAEMTVAWENTRFSFPITAAGG